MRSPMPHNSIRPSDLRVRFYILTRTSPINNLLPYYLAIADFKLKNYQVCSWVDKLVSFSSSTLHLFSLSPFLLFSSSSLSPFLLFSSSPFHPFSSSPLLPFTLSPLHLFSLSPFLLFSSSPFLLFSSSSLHPFPCTLYLSIPKQIFIEYPKITHKKQRRAKLTPQNLWLYTGSEQ